MSLSVLRTSALFHYKLSHFEMFPKESLKALLRTVDFQDEVSEFLHPIWFDIAFIIYLTLLILCQL